MKFKGLLLVSSDLLNIFYLSTIIEFSTEPVSRYPQEIFACWA